MTVDEEDDYIADLETLTDALLDYSRRLMEEPSFRLG